MRQINLVLDLYNILISLLLIVCLWINRKWKEKTNYLFIFICFFNITMLLGDITNWTCEGLSRPWFPAALRMGTILYFGSSAPLLLAFIAYVNTYLLRKKGQCKGVWNVACVLTAGQLLFSILSLWTGLFFDIGPDNIYRRGRHFWISQMIPILIYGMAVFLIIRNHKVIRRKDVFFFLGIVSLPLIAEVIQIMNYGLALINTGSTFALLLMFINIQLERASLIKKQENALTKASIDMMMSQIYPHFLYNILSVIRQLCDSDPAQAKEAIQELSRFLHTNMEFLTNKNPISFEQELTHVRGYLNLQKMRFGNRLHVIYDIAAKDFLLPSLTLQPIVENAVCHGVIKRAEGGTVTIRSEETTLACRIIVKDNGPGFSQTTRNSEHSNNCGGIGIENVKKRLRLLCNGSLEINNEPGCGVTVTITIPK